MFLPMDRESCLVNKLKPFLIATMLVLSACGGSGVYDVGVYNNTLHVPVEIKIQYPEPNGMKRIRFSMIEIGEFKSNQHNTRYNPIPQEAKISWKNSAGEVLSEVVDLSLIPVEQDNGAIMFVIDEYSVSVSYLDREAFAGEWAERLVRKGYK